MTNSCDRRLAQVGLQDRTARRFVWQRDVDELVQTARSQDGSVDDVRSECDRKHVVSDPLSQLNRHTVVRPRCAPVRGTDDENVLFVRHAVHLCQDLVDDSIRCTACIAGSTPSGFGDGVQLVEEQDAGRRLSGLRRRRREARGSG